ncbi:MAG TPA: hypothetical protein VKG87_04785, partial [Terriglobales bacterium]|nr:hypothetical protein [Terriglobales bacterium]
IESMFVERDESALQRWMEVRYEMPLEWQDAQWIGNFRMWGTAAEVRDFVEAVLFLAEPLRKAPAGEDAGREEVHFTFRVLPQ